ncbi:MAG: hypothetical protein WA728_33615 [Xanthobacteraceae bacterium]
MFRKLVVIGALGAMAVLFSTTAFAQGTAADAKAMLEKTVAAIKADKAKTLDQINKGENGFLVGDLYPFCFNLSDGLLVAVGNPNVKGLLGKDARTFKDPTGDVYAQGSMTRQKRARSMRSATILPRPALTRGGCRRRASLPRSPAWDAASVTTSSPTKPTVIWAPNCRTPTPTQCYFLA